MTFNTYIRCERRWLFSLLWCLLNLEHTAQRQKANSKLLSSWSLYFETTLNAYGVICFFQMCPVGLFVLKLGSIFQGCIIISRLSATFSVFIFTHPTFGICCITKKRKNLNWCHVGMSGRFRQIIHPGFRLLTSTSFLILRKSPLLFFCAMPMDRVLTQSIW